MRKVLLIVMVICLSAMMRLFGQATSNFEIIPQTLSNPEHQVFMANGDVPVHVANASLQITSTWGMNTLNAVVYNSSAGVMYMYILVLDDNSNIISFDSVRLPIDGYFPDVIIRDDINNPGQEWIVSIVLNTHTCPLSEVYLVEYKIDNPLGVNINFFNSSLVGTGIYPKIDGFIDHTIPAVDNELFVMTDFVIVFNNLNAVSNLTLMHYDFNSSLVNTDIIAGFLGFAPDVACVTNVMAGGAKFIYIVDINYTPPPPGGYINLLLYDVTNMTLISHDVTNYPTYLPFYRIDAHTLIEDFWNQNRYIISGTHDCHDHFFMLDNFIADFTNPPSYTTMVPNTTTGPSPGPVNWRPNGAHMVAAGMGYDLALGSMPPAFPSMPVGSRINREEFTTLHSYAAFPSGANLLMTNYLRPTGYNTPMPDMFWVNNVQYNYGSMTLPSSREICATCSVFADGGSGGMSACGHVDYSYFFSASLATQPNLGDYAVACWIDETNGSVNIKQTNNYANMAGSIISHNVEVVPEQGNEAIAFSVYPNPAREVIKLSANGNIESIEVFNILGQRVYQDQGINSTVYEIRTADISAGSPAVLLRVVVNGKQYLTKVMLDRH